VFASRYCPAYAAFDYLGRVRDAEPSWLEPRKLESLFIAGRNIGDEYRYILDRKYARSFRATCSNVQLVAEPLGRARHRDRRAGCRGRRGVRGQERGRRRSGRPGRDRGRSSRGGWGFCQPGFPGPSVGGAGEPGRRRPGPARHSPQGAGPASTSAHPGRRSAQHRVPVVSLPEVPGEALDLRLANGWTRSCTSRNKSRSARSTASSRSRSATSPRLGSRPTTAWRGSIRCT